MSQPYSDITAQYLELSQVAQVLPLEQPRQAAKQGQRKLGWPVALEADPTEHRGQPASLCLQNEDPVRGRTW
jgi:hypothetical protein